jgi:hypothetical protein
MDLSKKNSIINDQTYLNGLYSDWVSSLIENNVFFFSLTINLCTFFKNRTHKNFFTDLESCRIYIKSFLNSFSTLEFIDCSLGSIDINSNGVVSVHCVLGFRAHFNSVQFNLNRIQELILNNGLGDYQISFLKKSKSVVLFLQFLSKNFDKNRQLNYSFFSVFSSFFREIHNSLADILFDDGIRFIENKTDFDYYTCDEDSVPFGKFHDIMSTSKNLNREICYEFLFYLTFYFEKKNFLLYKNFLYRKKEHTVLSYILIDSIEIFISKNFLVLMNDLLTNYFDFLDITKFKILFPKYKNKIVDQLNFRSQNVSKTINFNLLEFQDGIYFATTDTFFPKSVNENTSLFYENFFTTRSYDINYADLNFDSSSDFKWKSKTNFNLIGSTFSVFCKEFRDVLFSSTDCCEKSALFALGTSNSSQLELVQNILLHSYGFPHVCFFSLDYKISNTVLTNTHLFIIQELSWNEQLFRQFKNLCLYSTEKVKTKILFISNNNKNKDLLFENKHVFYFNNSCFLTKEEYKEIINEIPKILVFCNKEYFKKEI